MALVDTGMEILNKLTRGHAERLLRFGSVSVIGVVLTQVLLVVFHGVLGANAWGSNLLAVSLAAWPVFVLNKRWVWGHDHPADVKREIVPFWLFTLLGLAISTVLVLIVDHYTDRTWPVMAANISGFGIVWVAKFLFLDSVVFGAAAERRLAEAAGEPA